MKKINFKKCKLKLKRFLTKLKKKIWILPVALMTTSSFSKCFASSISTAEVSQATENVKNAIIKLAMPIGGILVFTSIVIISLKMIVNANNANKRSESIGSLAWVVAGTLLLGLSLIVSGIILSVATNGSGSLIS